MGSRVAADHRRADGHVRPLGVDDDGVGAEPAGELGGVGIVGADDVRPRVERPAVAEQVDPLLPQHLVAEVGAQLVHDLDDRHVRVQLGEPAGAQVTGHGVARPAVDVDGEASAACRGLVDEERVPEVWRVEPPDHESRWGDHVTAAATTTGPR